MKTLINMTLTILIVVAGLFGIRYHLESSQGLTGDKVVNFYNWGDYIDKEVLREFEKEFDVKINYEENEWLYGYILSFGEYAKIVSPKNIKEIIKKKLQKSLNNYT